MEQINYLCRKLFEIRNMKYLLLLSFLIINLVGFSQDTTNNEKYKVGSISLVAIPRGIFLYLEEKGNKKPVKDKEGKTIRFSTTAAVYDYMDELGWQLVSAAPYGEHGWDIYCVFKRKTTLVGDP